MNSNYYRDTIETYNKLGQKYLFLIRNRDKKERVEFIKMLPKGSRVLDVGCAGGGDTKAFVDAGMKAVGIDLADSLLRIARKTAPKARFIKMDIRKLKIRDNQFDAIWAAAVLLHVLKKNIPAVLKKLHRILKPNGLFFLRVKQGRGMNVETHGITQTQRIFVYFSNREMDSYVKKAGFKIISSKIKPDGLGRKSVKWISVFARKI